MTVNDFISALSGGYFNDKMRMLYGDSENGILRNRIRFIECCEKFSRKYPDCDNIHVRSLPSEITVCGVPFMLTADRITITGDNPEYVCISDEIPKNFTAVNSDKTSAFPECFSGYSLCVSGTDGRKSCDIVSEVCCENFADAVSDLREKYSECEIYRLAVLHDEKNRRESACDAVMRGNTAEFFNILNNSQSHTLCSPEIRTAVLISRNFLNGDGAVTAENDTVKAFVPSYLADDYSRIMSAVFGCDVCRVMQIRYIGGFEFTL